MVYVYEREREREFYKHLINSFSCSLKEVLSKISSLPLTGTKVLVYLTISVEDGTDDARVVSERPVRLILVGDVMSLGEDIGAAKRTDLRDTLNVELMGLVLEYVWG